jgi:hypothetical protein
MILFQVFLKIMHSKMKDLYNKRKTKLLIIIKRYLLMIKLIEKMQLKLKIKMNDLKNIFLDFI